MAGVSQSENDEDGRETTIVNKMTVWADREAMLKCSTSCSLLARLGARCVVSHQVAAVNFQYAWEDHAQDLCRGKT